MPVDSLSLGYGNDIQDTSIRADGAGRGLPARSASPLGPPQAATLDNDLSRPARSPPLAGLSRGRAGLFARHGAGHHRVARRAVRAGWYPGGIGALSQWNPSCVPLT